MNLIDNDFAILKEKIEEIKDEKEQLKIKVTELESQKMDGEEKILISIINEISTYRNFPYDREELEKLENIREVLTFYETGKMENFPQLWRLVTPAADISKNISQFSRKY